MWFVAHVLCRGLGFRLLWLGESGSATMRAERAKLKSRRDDVIIAQGKRSAALGSGTKMICSFFLPVWGAFGAPNRKEKRELVGVAFYPGRRSLRSLAPGCCLAAPVGASEAGDPGRNASQTNEPRFQRSQDIWAGCTQTVGRPLAWVGMKEAVGVTVPRAASGKPRSDKPRSGQRPLGSHFRLPAPK